MDTGEDNISQCSDESLVLIRVNIPDLGVQKCMQFHRDELVWDVKQQVLAALPKELKESFNYGLYCPPSNGKAGKFLDEERPLLDYPFPGPIGYLELKYKRRVYKMMNVDEKQIKQLHTKANLRRLLDFVQGGQAEKISKLCAKGLDPNFHCHETGETPLSLASAQRKCNRTILALANGGALLDFRTRDGTTALHRAVEKNNLEAIKTLLDLGASPNYKDNKGLTALYCSVLMNADAHICELLLHDHATIGAADLQGWQEVHQACRNGLVQHLEHLLFYGADMNARNASGNTPLHVCAVNEQESCARVLLFRGADKDALNFANQTPYQVAVIAGNLALAEVIQNHSPEDIVPFREPPKYNPRRRASIASSAALNRTHSDPRLEITLGIKPPSPSPSNRSLPPFSSASSLSETSTGSSSTCTQPSNEDSEDTASVSVITEKSVTSDCSLTCGSITCSTGGYDNYPERPAPLEGPLAPGLMCVCLENYNADIPGHLQLSQGDIIEVTGSTDFGLLEGILRNQQGLFPALCVQEVRLRHPDARFPPRRVEGRREMSVRHQQMNSPPLNTKQQQRIGEPRTVMLRKGKKGFGFVLRGAKATSPLMEMLPTDHCPALQYLDDVDKGGVADLAGLKKGDFLLTINGEDVSQASHEHVVNMIRQSGELVAMSVMTIHRPCGILLERPQSMTPRQCATLPRKLMRSKAAPAPPRRDPRTTLSVGRARARSMVAGLAEIEALDRTLMEYDSEGRSTKSSSIESLPNKQQQLRSSDSLPPLKTASSMRPCAGRLTAAELQEMFARQQRRDEEEESKNDALLLLGSPKVYGSVAQMKRSRANKHKHGGSDSAVGKLHKDFHSTPDLNDSSLSAVVEIVTDVASTPKDARRSHSQEDVTVIHLNGRNLRLSWEGRSADGESKAKRPRDNLDLGEEGPWQSIEEIYNRVPPLEGATAERKRATKEPGIEHPPPPTHPPPPPPVGQVVRVDVSRSRSSEYAKVTMAPAEAAKTSVVMSSFRPGDSAKLYASPQEIGVIGYRAPVHAPALHVSHKPVSCASIRSRSLPPNVPPPPKTSSSSSTSSETETSGDSAGGGGGGGYTCSTFKKPYRQASVAPDAISTDSGNSSERGSHSSVPVVAGTTNPYAQPVVSYRDPLPYQNGHLSASSQVVEPYIPEPDYDVSDDDQVETRLTAAAIDVPIASTDTPLSTSCLLQPRPRSASERSTPLQQPVPPTECCRDGTEPQPTPPSRARPKGDRRKPPTPPTKRAAASNSGPPHDSHIGKQIGVVGEAVQRSPNVLPKNVNPIASAASGYKQAVLVPTTTDSAQRATAKGSAELPETTETVECAPERRLDVSTEMKAESWAIPGKPPCVGSKVVKAAAAAAPASATLSPATVRSETIALSDFKQIIAQKAAERQRRASFTVESGVGSPAGESPMTEAVESVAPVKEPSEPVSGPVLAVAEEHHAPLPQDDDIAINVKEQISVFEKKSESVKTSPSVVRSAAKKLESEPKKILKGSHSQIFETKILDKMNGGSLKPSKSCPFDFSREDGGLSGAISDEDARAEASSRPRDEPKEEPGEGKGRKEVDAQSDESDDSDGDMNDGPWNLKAKITETDSVLREDLEVAIASRKILTKNAVSLAKLPPPMETGETDAESDITEPTPPKAGGNSFDSSCNCSEPSSPDAKTSVARDGSVLEVRISDPSGGAATDLVEDEIRQSMKLIEVHATSLQQVNALAGLVPPPPGFDERPSGSGTNDDVGTIAPPPEFSDDVHVPIGRMEDGEGDDDSDSDEAEMAAKNAAAALAAAAGGLHLSCPSFVERSAASKLPIRSSHAGGTSPHNPPAKVSSRQMARPSNAKVRLLPTNAAGACNGLPSYEDAPTCYPTFHDPGVAAAPTPSVKLKTTGGLSSPVAAHKEFRTKAMNQWSTRDVSDWLESLFLPEYKARFEAAGVDGRRLSYLDNNSLVELGVKRVGHRMNMERSLRRHSMMKQ